MRIISPNCIYSIKKKKKKEKQNNACRNNLKLAIEICVAVKAQLKVLKFETLNYRFSGAQPFTATEI